MDLEALVRDIPDFPKKGILFKDLTTLWKDPAGFKEQIDGLALHFQNRSIDKVVGTESRGFIIGAPLAYVLGAGFVPVRKAGKLPAPTLQRAYALEYGEAQVEIHRDAIQPGERVLFVDDLLATGGTTAASLGLIRELGGEIISCAYIIELEFLNGRDVLDVPVISLIKVGDED